ncbi:GNAT family N-acetyltransferase [Pseudomonas carassii]|uniref:GNAT family N-acetyltransferase n=1 Tax=Pseudomonas carassii TaxID=3115855 RepID=A0ABU7HBR5_9PSED|nr:GNAT family N-acetyltransferase [Pseudomonas sp. 137P]MEE1888740.1 GNAT family N-acetyltransferase [Pseudomonas sp. 137P]
MKRQVSPFGDGVVELRLLEERDLHTTLSWRNRDEARVWFKTSAPLTMDQHAGWFSKYQQKNDDFLFVVESGGMPVGQASVYAIDWEKRSAEVGRFLVAPEGSGKGFIGRACAELVTFSRDVLGLGYIFLEVLESNERAIRLYLQNGFSEEGRSDGLIRMGQSLSPVGAK